MRTLAAALATTTCMVALATPAAAQTREYNIPAGSLKSTLDAYVRQSGREVVYRADEVRSARSPGVRGQLSADAALAALLAGSGFTIRVDGNLIAIVRAGNDGTFVSAAGRLGEAEAIVVTGSHIRGRRAAGMALEAYSREEIERTGAGTVTQFLEKLPQNHSSISGDSTLDPGSGNNSNNAAGVNLKGLGSNQTLILLNGRRVAPSGLGTITDVSMIPLAALDRIEVLTDGASAIYGSDAVAGVVNFVLMDDYEGAETRLRRETRVDSNSDRIALNQSLGASWDTGSGLVSLGWSHNSPLAAKDRPYIDIGPKHYFDAEEEEFNILSALNFKVNHRLRLSLDGFYSRAKTRSQVDISRFGLYSEHGAKTKAYNISGGADYEIGEEGWSLGAFASHAANEVAVKDLITNDIDDMTSEISEVGIKADGTIFGMPAGPVSLALGGSVRWERHARQSDSLDRLGYLSSPFDRRVDAAFAEINIPVVDGGSSTPLIDSVTVSAAVRHEKYTDFGRTTNPRVGIDWVPLKGVRVRASYGTSFSVSRYADTLASFNGGNIQKIDSPLCGNGCLVFTEYGNRSSYEPERSKSFTAGLDITPELVPGLSVETGYYWTEYRGRIGQVPSAEYILQNIDSFSGITIRNPSAEFIAKKIAELSEYLNGVVNYTGEDVGNGDFAYYLDRRQLNLGVTKTAGVTWNIRYQHPVALSTVLSAGISGNYILDFEDRIDPTSPPIEGRNRTHRPAALKGTASMNLTGEQYSVGLQVHYVGSYRNDLFVPNEKVSSWTTIDAHTSLYAGRLFGQDTKSLEFRLSAQNVLNKRAPFVRQLYYDRGFDPTNSNIFGRTIALELVKRW